MQRSVGPRTLLAISAWFVSAVVACSDLERLNQISLSQAERNSENSQVGPDAPKLGATGTVVAVRASPEPGAARLGYLTMGNQVRRSKESVGKTGCQDGWFAVAPRGYVCRSEGATLDLSDPLLKALGLMPELEAPLPYPYAATRSTTPLFAEDAASSDGVRSIGRVPQGASFAVLGSLWAFDNNDQRQRFAVLRPGHFVAGRDLAPVASTRNLSAELDEKTLRLPLAMTRAEARSYQRKDTGFAPQDKLGPGELRPLTGTHRRVDDVDWWETADHEYLRADEAVIIPGRNDYPDFVQADRHWVDIDGEQGVVILYQGQKAVFVALSPGVPQGPLPRGPTWISAKHLTDTAGSPEEYSLTREIHDVAWVVKLASGWVLHGRWWEESPEGKPPKGRIPLLPADARRLWAWVAPELPEGWNGVDSPSAETATPVLVH